ncbi:hypothetical protein J4216_00080 [Candidatus Woesearchaeota archaeon]|nr:hypothetical protein [Candidatus Woesearchaeota archaeon]
MVKKKVSKSENEAFVSDLREMYKILRKMINAAKKKDKDEFNRLNKIYDNYTISVYPKLDPKLRQTYDNCRSSCGLSLGLLENMYEEFINEAEILFSQIPKP